MQLALQVYTAIVPQSGAAASLASEASSFSSCGMICVTSGSLESKRLRRLHDHDYGGQVCISAYNMHAGWRAHTWNSNCRGLLQC